MKTRPLILLGLLSAIAGLALALGFFGARHHYEQLSKSERDRHAAAQAAWKSERTALEAGLAAARNHPTTLPGQPQMVEVARKLAPAEIIERLKTMKVKADQPRSGRLVAHELENLITCGADAVPPIRDFLKRNEDIDYDAGAFARSARNGKLPTEFNVPPSLRLGLFEALKLIGGDDAEQLLAESLNTAGRGLDVAFLARELEGMAPGKYREAALQAAHELLLHPLADAADKNDRIFLFATLLFLNDPSFAATAQAALVQADGKVDAAALKYLQQTQPEKTLALAIQAYADPHVTDPQARERLAQVAFDRAGADPQADAFFRAVLADTSLPADNRNNLAQDIADRGYTNLQDPSAADFQMMLNRLELLKRLQAETTDPVVAAGIVEAIKDLTKFIANYRAQHPQP